jgi:signal transduction histidine kinase
MDTLPPEAPRAALASYLAARRDEILKIWRGAAAADPELRSASALTRAEFDDHVPVVLDAFERALLADGASERGAAERQERAGAAAHGDDRWRHGYNQRELVREWGHLHLVLADELEACAAARPDLAAALPAARRALVRLCNEGVAESAACYARLQQTEAAGRVRDLQQALEQIQDLDRRRAEFWREAAHDLRGNVGAVRSMTAVLNHPAVAEPVRAEYLGRLEKGVAAVHELLDDLMSLARLEAGQERRALAPFDAAALMRDLCGQHQVLAEERGLWLKAAGPAALPAQGDAVKVRRVAQNLLLNALKYTEQGGVKVAWEEEGAGRWRLTVQDTGPGFAAGAPPLARALKDVGDESRGVEGVAPPTLRAASEQKSIAPGEGVGLAIVKRLCELLDAGLELETAPGRGTTIRVTFPRRYG